MTDGQPREPVPVYYEIRVHERLDASWSDWLGGLTLDHDHDGATVISGPLPDQAALYGVLSQLRDLGLTLLSVSSSGPTTRAVP